MPQGEAVHNKLIAAAAHTHLKPLGLRRRGRSRVWVDDHGWWLIVVEFQPSRWSRGTYLNVGAMWLWDDGDTLAFHFGHRVPDVEFREYDNPEAFARAVDEIAARAASETMRIRKLFPSIEAIAAELQPELDRGPRQRFHAAIAHALAGNFDRAKRNLNDLARPEAGDPQWLSQMRGRAAHLGRLTDDPTAFRASIAEAISSGRASLKLPAWSGAIE